MAESRTLHKHFAQAGIKAHLLGNSFPLYALAFMCGLYHMILNQLCIFRPLPPSGTYCMSGCNGVHSRMWLLSLQW